MEKDGRIEPLEEWELIAEKAQELSGNQQILSTEYQSLEQTYRARCREKHERSTTTEQITQAIDISSRNQAGWRNRRQLLNKLIELHEDHDDIDTYGFPMSGPFSFLAMKLRHPLLFDQYVGKDTTLGIGSGSSAFGDLLYGDIGLDTNMAEDQPFSRGSLVAKLAWGVLQRESYHQTVEHEPPPGKPTSALPTVPHDAMEKDEAMEEESLEFPFDEEPTPRKTTDRSTITVQSDAFDLAQAAVNQAKDNVLISPNASKIPMASAATPYTNRIVDTEEDHERQQQNAERIKRLRERMTQKHREVAVSANPSNDQAEGPVSASELCLPPEPRLSENQQHLLEVWAEEVHRIFVSGQDEEAEDELNDLLKRNAVDVQASLMTERCVFDDKRREEMYFELDEL